MTNGGKPLYALEKDSLDEISDRLSKRPRVAERLVGVATKHISKILSTIKKICLRCSHSLVGTDALDSSNVVRTHVVEARIAHSQYVFTQ